MHVTMCITDISSFFQVCDWSIEEVCLLVDTVINWELQPRNIQSAGKNMAKAASEVLWTRGFDKTPGQCQDQWHYLVAAFRRGGYRQFMDQMNLIHLLVPSLLHPHPTSSHPNTRVAKNHHQQVDGQTSHIKQGNQVSGVQISGDQSQSICKEQTARHSSKKIKIENQDMAVLTFSEEDLENRANTSAPGNVASYVRINVPQQSTPKQRHVQVSTDEVRDWEQEEDIHVTSIYEASLDIKKEPDDLDFIKTSALISPQVKNSRKNIRGQGRKSVGGRGRLKAGRSPFIKMKTMNPSSEQVSDIFHSSSESQDDTVQVEVLSVTKSENAKMVECRTVEGIIPTRTIKLHYPLSYTLPTSITHMYVPRTMVHPDLSAANKIHLSHSSNTHSISKRETSNPSSQLKEESKEIACEENGYDEINKSYNSTFGSVFSKEGSEKWEIRKLLAQYSQQCRQEKTRLLNTLQESHQQQTFALKKILSVFQQLQESL